jgi:hypothetical protein
MRVAAILLERLKWSEGLGSTADSPQGTLDPASPSQSHGLQIPESESHVVKAAAGVQGYSMVWADDASSITRLAVPTSRNLAVASPGVNKFSWLGYANVRQKRLPSPGTSVSCPVGTTIVYVLKNSPARRNLLFSLP